MKNLKIIWILHRSAVVTALVCLVLLIVCAFCSAMSGFEQGQISVASGQVTCFKSVSQWICEEIK